MIRKIHSRSDSVCSQEKAQLLSFIVSHVGLMMTHILLINSVCLNSYIINATKSRTSSFLFSLNLLVLN